jgi:hypothetical protein
MIGPKVAPQTAVEQRDAYEVVTYRDGGVCVRCKRTHPLLGVNRDHRQNRRPGNTTPANLQLLCGSGTTGCHGWKTENPKASEREGWSVPGWADPAEWPARRWFSTHLGTLEIGWCLYSNDGGVERITEEDARRRIEGTGTNQ